jgi:D-3-phosphoglycerate dehydrogenase
MIRKNKLNLLIFNISEYNKQQIRNLKNHLNIYFIENPNKKNFEKLLKKLNDKNIKINYLISNFGIKFDKNLIDKLPNLKMILTPTTGINHIDTKYLKLKKIKLFSLLKNHKLKKITSTAEHTWALILAISRNLIHYSRDVLENGKWERKKYLNFQLNEKILGIVGFGRLGKMVKRYAKAFNMATLIFDKKKGIKNKCSLQKVFSKSDIVTIHLELNSKTRGIISKKIIKIAKKNLIIINTSRGEVIDEQFMFEQLKKNNIKYFGADVLVNDHMWTKKIPYKKKVEINKIKNKILLTPHVGGNTVEANKVTRKIILDKLLEIIKKN